MITPVRHNERFHKPAENQQFTLACSHNFHLPVNQSDKKWNYHMPTCLTDPCCPGFFHDINEKKKRRRVRARQNIYMARAT